MVIKDLQKYNIETIEEFEGFILKKMGLNMNKLMKNLNESQKFPEDTQECIEKIKSI